MYVCKIAENQKMIKNKLSRKSVVLGISTYVVTVVSVKVRTLGALAIAKRSKKITIPFI